LLTLTVAFNHMPSPYHLMLSVAMTMLHCLAITALAVYSPVIIAVIIFGSIIALTNSSFSSSLDRFIHFRNEILLQLLYTESRVFLPLPFGKLVVQEAPYTKLGIST